MSLTVAAILLGFVILTTPIFAREKPPLFDLSLLFLVSVLLFARGPEPAQTYLFIAAIAWAALLFSLTLIHVPREALSRIRVELALFAALTVALVLAEFVLPYTRAVQIPTLIIVVGLAAALIISGTTRGTIFLFRNWRNRQKS